jgi:uncharacterized protein (UPF0261 family)
MVSPGGRLPAPMTDDRGMSGIPTVVLLGTLDTKGPEHAFVRDRLRDAGVEVLLVDVGILDTPTVEPDVPAHDVARAAGTTIEELRAAGMAAGHRAIALEAMARGATALVDGWRRAGRCDGVMGLGGSGGSAIVSAVLRSLPIGVPKLLVSTMTSGDMRPYVGTRDLTLVNAVTDIQGLNRVSRRVLENAANAMAGMVLRVSVASDGDAPLVAISMMGVTTPGAQGVQARLEAAGFETIVFHANGAGGLAMEELIEAGAVDGVVDLTTNELTSELYGGILSAGPDRLTAAGRRGIPQVVAPGALEVINFGPRASVPEAFAGSGRRIVIHSATVTSVRATAAEAAEIGALFARRVSTATGPTAVLLPLGGCSKYELPPGPFVDPEADAALFGAIRAGLRSGIACDDVDANINDATFAEAATRTFLALWQQAQPRLEEARQEARRHAGQEG